MGPLPQTPNDRIVPLMVHPFVPDQGTMCNTCAHGDTIVEEVFNVINDCLNGSMTLEDTILTYRGVKGRPIRKQGQQMILGYQTEQAIIQEYPVSNDLITASVYSQHVTIPHRECKYGQMIRAHLTVPKCSDTSLIIEKRVSACFLDYCVQPTNGLGIFAVTKDHKVEQERQNIYYDFYLTVDPMFEPLIGFRHVGDQHLSTPLYAGVLEALQLEREIEDEGALRLMVEDDFFN
jgi:hypothetical protein